MTTNEFTNLEAKRDAMRVGTDRLLATLGLTRRSFDTQSDAEIHDALAGAYAKLGVADASADLKQIAATARELEQVTPESLDGFFAAHNVRISAERQVNPAAQALAASWVEPTLASDIAEMMKGWNEIEATAKAQFPNATSEEIYQIAAGAMNHTLGLRAA